MTRLAAIDKNRITADFFDGYAEDFDSIYGSGKDRVSRFINRVFRKSIQKRYELTLNACRDIMGKRVLDVGCGPGHYSVALAKRGAGWVHGIDFAPQMIELARKKAEAMKVSENCLFEVKDFYAIDCNNYDYLILMGFMDYVEDARLCIEKAISLCQGKVFFSFPVSDGILAWQRKIRYKRKCPLYLYSYNDLLRLFYSIPGLKFRIRNLGRDFWVEAWKLQDQERQ